jgi:hypothetical protein
MSDSSRIGTLEATVRDQAAFLDELRGALGSHDSAFRDIQLAELEQRLAPSLPGAPANPATVSREGSMGGLGSAYSTSVSLGGAGLSVIDGAISVQNGSSTVVIDGTSNMFKIAATGTQSVVFQTGVGIVTALVTLTSLGSSFSTPPAAVWNIYTSVAAASRGGFWFEPVSSSVDGWMYGGIRVVAGEVVMVFCVNENVWSLVSGGTGYCRYYVLKEAGI